MSVVGLSMKLLGIQCYCEVNQGGLKLLIESQRGISKYLTIFFLFNHFFSFLFQW